MLAVGFSTERLTIRPWRTEDVAWYVGSIDDEILRWTRETSDMSDGDWAQLVGSPSTIDADTSLCIENESGKPVGSFVLRVRVDAVELAYWLAPAERRKGYASEALSGAVEWCGELHPGIPVVLEIHPGNAPSVAVAERAGFSFEALRPSCASCSDDNGQVAVYRRPG